MKIASLFFMALLLTGISTVYGQELLGANRGGELGDTSGWFTGGSVTTLSCQGTTIHTGSWALQRTGGYAVNLDYRGDCTGVADDTVINGQAWAIQPGGTATHRIYTNFYDGGGVFIHGGAATVGTQVAPGGTWTQYDNTATKLAGDVQVGIVIRNVGTAPDSYYDDYSAQPAPAVMTWELY